MWWERHRRNGAESGAIVAAVPRAGERWPAEDDCRYCERRVAEEEDLARQAGSWEAGLVHEQLAMLYRAQLTTLRRARENAQADGTANIHTSNS